MLGNGFVDCNSTLKGCSTTASLAGVGKDLTVTLWGWAVDSFLLYSQPPGMKLTWYPYRLFGAYYCGPGGAGPKGGFINGACAVHDDCYEKAGINADGNTNSKIVWKPGQVAAATSCNQQLYNTVKTSSDAGASSLQLWLRYGDRVPIIPILRKGTTVR